MNKSIFSFAFSIVLVLSAFNFQAAEKDGLTPTAEVYAVTTFAGNGENRTIDGPADKASFSSSLGNLTTDATGNVYVMDFKNLRKVSPDGMVNTLFGNDVYDAEGNQKEIGRELKAGARGIVIDKAGTIYISEQFGHGISKISNEKIVESYAGQSQYSGRDDGDAKLAEFKGPKDMCMDKAGNIYLIDNYYKVRKISADGKKVTTLAGSDEHGGEYKSGTGKAASFKDIGGIAVDSKGNVYVSQPDINCIIKITPSGMVSPLAGDPSITNGSTKDGTGKAARFLRPGAIACDGNDNIYVADSRKIRKITSAGVVTTIAGASNDGDSVGGFRDGDGQKALFTSFDGIACDAAGNIYVTDIGNYRIRKISKQ
jgi:sugar lactone lactonase YvrE